jgi:hypothetical protein
MENKSGLSDLVWASFLLVNRAHEDGGTIKIRQNEHNLVASTPGRAWTNPTDLDLKVILAHCESDGLLKRVSTDEYVITARAIEILTKTFPPLPPQQETSRIGF